MAKTSNNNIDTDYLIKLTESYNEESLTGLLFSCDLRPAEISELYGKRPDGTPLIPIHKIYADMHKWGLTKRFVSGISITDLFEKKIEEYRKIINKYSSSNKANYRKVEELLKIKEKIIKAIESYSKKDGVSEDYIGLLEDIKNKIGEDDLSLSTIVKLQQKDEEIVRDYHKLMQDAATRLLNARERERIEFIANEGLTSAYESLKRLDYQNEGKTEYAKFFYVNTMKKMKQITGGAILDKTFDPEEVHKELEGMRIARSERHKKAGEKISIKVRVHTEKAKALAEKFDVHYQVASSAAKLLKDKPELTEEQAIQIVISDVITKYPYIGSDGKTKKKSETIKTES